MAEQESPREGPRRRRGPGSDSGGRPDEVLLWLLTPAGILIGWAPKDWTDYQRGAGSFPLRLPVQIHQVPMGSGGGGQALAVAQLYTPLALEVVQVNRANVVALTHLPPEDPHAEFHQQAILQRASGLVLPPAGGKIAH